MRVRENVTLPVLQRFTRAGRVQAALEAAAAQRAVAGVDLRPPDPERPTHTLSGGNQQKVVLAKWLLTDAAGVLFDEPTRGVEVGAKTHLHRQIRALADAGKAAARDPSHRPELPA